MQVWCVAPNDHFVMHAWGHELGAHGKVRMMGDGSHLCAAALGLQWDLSAKGMGMRCHRALLLLRNGVVVHAVSDGRTYELVAGTLVLAAGVYGTPLILQRSGIGDPERLRAVGVEPVLDLPGVGANLHDHPLVLVDREGGGLEEPRIGRRWRALDVDNGWRRAVDRRGEHQADGLVRPHDHLPRLGIEALISCMVDQAVALPAPPAREPVGRCPRYGLEGHALLLLGGDHIAPVEIVTEVGNAAHGGYGCVIRFCARRRDYGAILVCTLPHGWA